MSTNRSTATSPYINQPAKFVDARCIFLCLWTSLRGWAYERTNATVTVCSTYLSTLSGKGMIELVRCGKDSFLNDTGITGFQMGSSFSLFGTPASLFSILDAVINSSLQVSNYLSIIPTEGRDYLKHLEPKTYSRSGAYQLVIPI